MWLDSFKIAENLIALSTRSVDAGPILENPPINPSYSNVSWKSVQLAVTRHAPCLGLWDNMVLSRPIALSSELSMGKPSKKFPPSFHTPRNPPHLCSQVPVRSGCFYEGGLCFPPLSPLNILFIGLEPLRPTYCFHHRYNLHSAWHRDFQIKSKQIITWEQRIFHVSHKMTWYLWYCTALLLAIS